MNKLNDARFRLHEAGGHLVYNLEIFGDQLAVREGYREHKGLDAVRFFLMSKHHWLPRDVITMSSDDLQFAMAEEMVGWTLPKDAVPNS